MLQEINKRGVSEIVAYVILMLIVLAIGSLVYSWTISNIPKDNEKCSEGLSLMIKEYNCSRDLLNVNIKNNGLFDVDGFYVKAGNDSTGRRIIELTEIRGEKGKIIFKQEGKKTKLGPEQTANINFSYEGYNTITEIEIEPFIIGSKEPILCDGAIVSQKINCN